ncbi:hypothetical protein ACFE04_021089 [Oxalis oulophora]
MNSIRRSMIIAREQRIPLLLRSSSRSSSYARYFTSTAITNNNNSTSANINNDASQGRPSIEKWPLHPCVFSGRPRFLCPYTSSRSDNYVRLFGYVDGPVSYGRISRYVDDGSDVESDVPENDQSDPSELYYSSSTTEGERDYSDLADPSYAKEYIYYAQTFIKLAATSDSPRLLVIFKGGLARSVAFHLKDKDHVKIRGQLFARYKDHFLPPSGQVSNHQGNVEGMVWVSNVDLVDETYEQDEQETFKHSVNANLDFWRDLVHNPKQWQDFRIPKFNGMFEGEHPDFKHKATGHPLWAIVAPQWVLPKLRELMSENLNRFKESKLLNNQTKPHEVSLIFYKKLVKGEIFVMKVFDGDEPPRDVLANPRKCGENKVDKKNWKNPDFEHRDSGEVVRIALRSRGAGDVNNARRLCPTSVVNRPN